MPRRRLRTALTSDGHAPRRAQRWIWVVAVSLFINTSYGTLSYAFSVLVTNSGAGGEFGVRIVSTGFGLALLVSGFAAVATGTIADLFGTRRLMAAGATLGALGLALLAACTEAWQFLLVMPLVIGPAMAATFYEPVYVLMNRWFESNERPRAYGVLTLLSGFSITIFTPLTRWLVSALGWRDAVLSLAAILLVVGLLVPLCVREPAPDRHERARSPRAFLIESRQGLRHTTRAFWLFTLAFFFATVAFNGFSFHMVSQLETRGFGEASVANAIAVTGIISLPGRLLLPMLSGRTPSAILLGVCLALLGVAAWLASSAGDWWQVWVYIAVFGAVFGAVYPLRALVMADRFAGPYFGRAIGIQALFVAVGRALGPVIIGAIGTDRQAYEVGFRVAAIVLLLSAFASWWAMRGRHSHPVALDEASVIPG
jgi:MFS family permease